MDGSHCCMDCGAVLQADDGHDLCPTWLERDHLVEALSENPCMNYSFMPRALRVARLAQLCPQDDAELPPCGQVAPLRHGRVLAAIHKSFKAGLDRMPAVEHTVASLIVSPDEAQRPDVRCPRTQCQVTDDLLCKAYNAGARAGRLGNSMAHLMFALSASLQDAGGATAAVGFSDAALQAFALMTRELGCVMSFLVQARRQARQTSQQLSGLRRSMPPPQRSSRPSVSPSARPPPQHSDRSVRFYPREVRQRPNRDFRQRVRRPVRQTRDPGRPHPSAPRGSGGRR
ncbi:hypothetical protein GOODEAATRI_033211 [Goodea atripinnis]|uniref:Uncharacterized protein n=1 Tax=Goodea atripinnis TaxID=208336 RepID=A0ABV0Q3U0_9TELE